MCIRTHIYVCVCIYIHVYVWMCQFSSVAQLCLTLCDPMDCSIAGFPVHHQLLELAQTHVHQAGNAIKPVMPSSQYVCIDVCVCVCVCYYLVDS